MDAAQMSKIDSYYQYSLAPPWRAQECLERLYKEAKKNIIYQKYR